MDLLDGENGSSLIETLVSILILGIVVTIFFSIYMAVYTNPRVQYKPEALSLANQEVVNSIRNKVISDTSYYNLNNNLLITRNVSFSNRIYRVDVRVSYSTEQKEIVKMSGMFVK